MGVIKMGGQTSSLDRRSDGEGHQEEAGNKEVLHGSLLKDWGLNGV